MIRAGLRDRSRIYLDVGEIYSRFFLGGGGGGISMYLIGSSYSCELVWIFI